MNASYAIGSYRTSEGSVCGRSRSTLGTTRRGVLFAAGAGGTALTEFGASYVHQPRMFTECGYPFLSADLSAAAYAGYTFGNDDSITATGLAWTYIKSATGLAAKTDKVVLFGGSMGAQVLLNWCIASTNAADVLAIGLLIPALDVDDAYQNNIGGLRALIGTAYGVTHPTAIPNLATHSPASYSNADKAKLTMPIHLWTSDDDPYTSTAEATTWATSVNAQTGTSNVVVESIGAIGHSASTVTPAQLVAFFDANGGRS